MPASSPTTLTVDASSKGQRLDRWLANALPHRSRSEIQRWIREGRVAVDGQLAKASHKLEDQQVVSVLVPASASVETLAAEPLPLQIIYEDDSILVVDKPAGMVVHPAPGHAAGTLVNAILHHCPGIEGVGGTRRPGIVHRLDKDTSGLIVVAKHDRAHRDLQAQFKARTVYKEYLALVEGRLSPEQGRISAPIGRHPVDRKRQAVFSPSEPGGKTAGRDAVTEYQVLAVYTAPSTGGSAAVATFSLVRAVLLTGRTHQIRVHFAWLKHPVVGDTVYGLRRQRIPLPRHFLHAHQLRLRLPSTGEERTFTAPLPPELQAVLDDLSRG